MAYTSKSPPEAAERQVPDYASPPVESKQSFSNHLAEVEWIHNVEFPPPVVEATKHWEWTATNFPLGDNWVVYETSIGKYRQPILSKTDRY